MFRVLNNNYLTWKDITIDDENGNKAFILLNLTTEETKAAHCNRNNTE